MRSVLLELDDHLRAGRSVCYTALVETRGSTPQKAGASMLVFPDGSQRGTLGGGCVEAEVKRRALQVLESGDAELMTFHLDNDYGWDDGLICGGRMKMLVDPLRPGGDASYYRAVADQLLAARGCTEAVALETNGPLTAGDHWLFDESGQMLASRNSNAAPAQVTASLRELTSRPRPYVTNGVSYLPHLSRCRLIVIGAGHVGQKVAQLAHDVDFDVWVVDDREEYCNTERFPQAKRLIVAPFETSLSALNIDSDTYCLIVTRGHNHDEEALAYIAESPARYIGLIGSKRKIKLIFADLLKKGISAEALRRVFAPLGFDIGSQTVPEIAISILAELIAHRNLGHVPEGVRPASLLDEFSQ
jgi:xanthine dehydrogenase accessory factor